MIPSRRPSRQRGASALQHAGPGDHRRLLHADGGARVPVGQRVPDDPQGGLADHARATRPARPTSAARSRRPSRSSTRSRRSARKDLDIQPIGDTGAFATSFAYNVEIPIVEPVVPAGEVLGLAPRPAASRGPERDHVRQARRQRPPAGRRWSSNGSATSSPSARCSSARSRTAASAPTTTSASSSWATRC